MRKPPTSPSSSGAFTLVELLVVIAIVGILSAIVLGVVGKVQQVSRRAVCASNLRQTGMAVLLYAVENKNRLPGPLHSTYGPYPKAVNATMLSHYIYGAMTGGRDIMQIGPAQLVRVDVFACPAWSSQIPLADQTANNGDSRSYIISQRVKNTLSGGLREPFGYPPANPQAPSTQPLRLSEILNPAASWMITDLDAQLSAGYTSQAYAPKTPVHGNIRNAVFFDAHVEAKPAAAFSLNSDSFNY